MANSRTFDGEIISPIDSLEQLLKDGGTTLLRATFEHSYFADPENVRGNTPLYPDRARTSRKHYLKLQKGASATWLDGRTVKLCDNAKAQQAWRRYTGRPIQRGSGYGVRHVWGHPWDPDAFTASWNLCYMPYWAGMLTEEQHPHPELVRAVRQAAWNLHFRDDPVCAPPPFVSNPGMDLEAVLDGLPILILAGRNPAPETSLPQSASQGDVDEVLRDVRRMRRQSWSNLRKAVFALQAKPHSPFSTSNVEAAAKNAVTLMGRRTGLGLVALEERLVALSSARSE